MLPSIREHGAPYITKEKVRELFGLIDDDEAEAIRRLRNPSRGRLFHNDVVNYTEIDYPHVLVAPGLGENQIAHFSRLDS